MTACRRTSPVSMYRLVNVSLNPFGRCGAPEAEPGPSAMGRLAADEAMRASFRRPAVLLGLGNVTQACSQRVQVAPVNTLGHPLVWPPRPQPLGAGAADPRLRPAGFHRPRSPWCGTDTVVGVDEEGAGLSPAAAGSNDEAAR